MIATNRNTEPDSDPGMCTERVVALSPSGPDPHRVLETFTLPATLKDISYASDEVTALCPLTGQPDWYSVRISISQTSLGLESKALKLYLQSFRDERHFCEHLADTLVRDIHAATGAAVEVETLQKPRGGISIRARACAS